MLVKQLEQNPTLTLRSWGHEGSQTIKNNQAVPRYYRTIGNYRKWLYNIKRGENPSIGSLVERLERMYDKLIVKASRLITEVIPLAVECGKINVGVANIFIMTLGIYIGMSIESRNDAYASFESLVNKISAVIK